VKPSQRINLISDTVTRPTPGMIHAMMNAEVGDDVFNEDPTVIELEVKLSKLFGHEAGLFCPSGTMTNQIAIKAHTNPLDELICEENSHVYQYEVGGYAFHSGIAVNPIKTANGKLNSALIAGNIKSPNDWLPNTKLVVIENTSNRTGGNYYRLEELTSISSTCKQFGLKLHMDGARIFNAIVESGYTSTEIGPLFNSISVCLSKGLGAPVGSVLLGPAEWIKKCRKIRKVMGGGMRQVGILAAAGIYALDHQIDRLKTDHIHAKRIESCLRQAKYVTVIKNVETNIIIFDLVEALNPQSFIEQLNSYGIHASAFGKQSIRFVTHLDLSEQMIDEVETVLKDKIKY
jgi:threonine aldolase